MEYVRRVDAVTRDAGRRTVLPDPALWDFAAFGTEYPTRRPKTWLAVSKSIHHKAIAPLQCDLSGERSNVLGISDLIGNVWEWCLPGETAPAVLGPLEVEPQLRGGGFLDDLSRTSVFLDASMLPDREETRHSDLGFRIAGKVPVSELPDTVQVRLTVCARLEAHRVVPYISAAR
jgi:Sulfatase-modifying factor enzyme 1